MFLSVLAATLTAGTDEMLGDYGVSTNSVVATPVGYEKRVKLDTGETVRMYPDRLDHNSLTNCHGVLFCILSPDELRGKYFLLNHGGCNCYMCRPLDVMTNLYVIGRHYAFAEMPDHPHRYYRKAAFELGSPGNPSMEFDWGKKVYCNIEDVDTRLRNLVSRLSAEQGNVRRLRDELAKCPKPAKAKLDDEPQPIRDMRKRRQKLARQILEGQRLTNSISRLVQRAEQRRDWLQSHGGAIANRIEPDRLCWNDRVRALANCQLPSRSYRGATVEEILSDLRRLALTNGVEECCLNCVGDLEVRGVPDGVRWMRKYDFELPACSAQDMFLKVGSLPDVSMRVKRKYDSWEISYSVPGDSPYADWSGSAYMTNCPPVEFRNVTLAEAVKPFQKLLEGRKNISVDVSARIKNLRRSFAFKGKTLRGAIAEVEKAFGVAYDFNYGHWFDPQEPPVLSRGAKLLKCERSVWVLDREIRQTVPLTIAQVNLLNEMMKRCEAATRDFVECEYFLDHDDYGTSYGIMVDDALGEVQGFDLGSRPGLAQVTDSRQRHYVLLLKNAEDRRKLYSFLMVELQKWWKAPPNQAELEAEVRTVNRLHEVKISKFRFAPTNTIYDVVGLFRRVMKEDDAKSEKEERLTWSVDRSSSEMPEVAECSATDISVYDALRLVGKVMGFRFKIEGTDISFSPKGVIVEDYGTRTYAVLDKDPKRDWHAFLAARGVKLPRDSSITYEEQKVGKLRVTSTEEGFVQFEKVLDELARTSEVQMLDSEGEVLHSLRANRALDTITQFSTVDALLASAYDGWVTVGELREHGSLGIGTPDRIDGELILLDDVAYSARGDGSVKVLNNSDTIAFASVADTSRGVPFPIAGGSYAEFCSEVDQRSYPNQPMAIRMNGTFATMCVRSELAQRKPYRPLAEVMKQDERKFDYQNVKGTLVGFRLPQFVKGENVPGWHLHFISADRQFGGHVLDFSARDLDGKVYYYNRLQTVLPDVLHSFHKVDHNVDRSLELEQVERGQTGKQVERKQEERK